MVSLKKSCLGKKHLQGSRETANIILSYIDFFIQQVTFEAVRGSNYTSDIAIDDVILTSLACGS